MLVIRLYIGVNVQSCYKEKGARFNNKNFQFIILLDGAI